MLKAGLLVLMCMGTAFAQPTGRWWLGILDTDGRAYLEQPATARDCSERDRAVREAGVSAGSLVRSRRAPAEYFPPGARLAVTVTDFDGRSSERVVTRVVGIAREEEGRRGLLNGACWYLAEPRVDGVTGAIQEDRPIVGVHPSRPLALRRYDQAWHGFGDAPRLADDNRFRAESDLPEPLRKRLAELLPGADQYHAQPFEAVTEPGGPRRALWLAGGVVQAEAAGGGAATFRALNLILPAARDRIADASVAGALFQAGPSDKGPAAYVAQVAAVVDLDGDGIEEIILRARYYAGGNFKVLRWNGARFVVVHDGSYEGE